MPVGHYSVRLVRSYRGMAPGTVVAVTTELADRLVTTGYAVQASPAAARQRAEHERGVATRACETRGTTP